MASDVKGYVVRWTDDSAPIRASGFLYATEAGNVSTRRERAALFHSIGEALDGARTCDPGRPDRETIFRVYANGREERLPSLAEALAEVERLRAQLDAARRLAKMAQRDIDKRDLGEAMPHEWFVLCGVLEDGIGSEAQRLLETTESRTT